MGIATLFRQAFSLFQSSLASLCPFLLLGLVPSAIIYTFEEMKWETLILSIIIGIVVRTCLIIGVYLIHNKQLLCYLTIIKKSLSKIFSNITLILTYLLPILILSALLLLFSIIGTIVFGSPEPSVSSQVSTSSLSYMFELVISVLYCTAGLFCLYGVVLYFNFAQCNLLIKNVSLWESRKQSKKLVKNRKGYVLFVFALIYILASIIAFTAQNFLGSMVGLAILWFLYIPFEVCLIVVFYNYLEQKLSSR